MNFLEKNITYLCEKKGILLEDLQIEDASLLNANELIALAQQFAISLDELLLKNLSVQEILTGKDLRFLILDVDGVLTDGGMYYSEAGEGDEFKKFNAKDGMAIKKLLKRGFGVGLLSSGTNANLIKRRAATLDIPFVHAGKEPKLEIFKSWCTHLGIGVENAIHFGDDINDLPLMQQAGLSVCPADAVKAVRSSVDIRMTKNGGQACVREFIDDYLWPYLERQ